MKMDASFTFGLCAGIILMIGLAEIHANGAAIACKEIAHTECHLQWVPVTKSGDEK